MNGLGVLLTTLIALALLAGSRAVAVMAILAAVLYLPQQQSVEVAGLTITALRLIELVAISRVVFRAEWSGLALNGIDRLFLVTYLYTATVFFLRSAVAIPETIGWVTDSLLCYVVFRCLVRSYEDFTLILKGLVVLFLPFLVLLAIEVATGRNPFAALGTWTAWVELREGRVRAMGSFRNPSLLGTLGACFLPLYLALVARRTGRRIAMVGVVACICIVYASNSGSPLSAMAAGLIAALLWCARTHTRLLRWAAFACLGVLALSMQAPVWSLLERMSFITGGSGWHRAHLLTMAWQDFGKWWQFGMPLSETLHWFPYSLSLTGTADITNTFVDFGLKAGLPALVLFVWLIGAAFGAVGRCVNAPLDKGPSRDHRILLWGLGCALATHIAMWFGITYFDQTYVLWMLHLATIASLAGARHAQPAAEGSRGGAPHDPSLPGAGPSTPTPDLGHVNP